MNVALHGVLTEFLKDWALLGRLVNSVPDDFYFFDMEINNDMKAEIYKILLGVDNKELTPEQAQIELVGLFSVTHRTSPNTYIGDEMKNCKLGLYEVFWKSGGRSIASIGNMHNGDRWIAPTNWTSESDPTGRLDDKMIDSIERIILLYGG